MAINRRELLVAAATTGVIATATPVRAQGLRPAKAPAIDPAVLVDTAQGRVRGYRDADVRIFKGIPYATDTGGAARFLPPGPAPKWAGTRSCLNWGPVCPQAPRTGWANDEEAWLFHWDDGYPGEDCLRLNVWGRVDARNAPVMVWIHGGGYTAGSAQELAGYDGTRMAANHGVIFVSVNHRLGPLGYMDLSEVGGSAYAQSGNAGMLDLVAALQWVKTNIAAFGGDPGRVTIFGQSGGGSKVSTLMGMPAAVGLFHRAMIHSGSSLLANDSDRARAFTRDVMAELGIGREMFRLQSVPSAALIEAGQRVARRLAAGQPTNLTIGGPRRRAPGWSPVVDGVTIPEAPFAERAPAISAKVPLVVGCVRDEFGGVLTDLSEDELFKRMANIPADNRAAALAAFRTAYPGLPDGHLARIMAASSLRNSSVQFAALKTAQGTPAYTWHMTFACPNLEGRWGSFHCIDIPFATDNVARWATVTGNTPGAQALGRAMSGAWAAFAHTGSPSTKALAWPAHDERVPTMVFDTDTRVVMDPAGAARRAVM
ncbi:carboxylesterase/lipase family protein [Novosphingobium piscinae]|uniref:Carboxylic ester hydrolase n=1 Tax=Novosphingobium piscinae TaxID=1507448 RepID=A0A7X1G0K2_9SPHN|nr:carboxylesterase family protein [Novosphingobium piscinae]MBC2669772.1 carboxylesterase/lipase family protein [Novosphingobium piscinae]